MDDRNFDLDGLMNELTGQIEDIVERAVYEATEDALRDTAEDVLNDLLEEQLREAVHDAVRETLPEIFGESLTGFDFVLKDGTLVRPRQRTKVLSPDKSKLLICYGGLRVDGTSLFVQTRVSCWECIAVYSDREAAITALSRIHEAMEAGEKLVEL